MASNHVTLSYLKGALFTIADEKNKIKIYSVSKRWRHNYSGYRNGIISLRNIFWFSTCFPRIWIFLSITLRMISLKKSLYVLDQNGNIVSEHSSYRFSKFYEKSANFNNYYIRLNAFKYPLLLLKYYIITNKLIKRLGPVCPEILAKYLLGYVFWIGVTRHSGTYFKSITINDDFMPIDIGSLIAFSDNKLKTRVYRINDARGRLVGPIFVDELYCMSEEQKLEFSRSRVSYYIRPTQLNIREIDEFSNVPLIVGIPLPSKFDIIKVLDKISSISFDREVSYVLRLHPSSKREIYSVKDIIANEGFDILIREADESIDLFAESVDFCLAGNTSAVKDLYNLGVPIVYSADLDDAPYDFHGWVEQGIIYNAGLLSLISVREINYFYEVC